MNRQERGFRAALKAAKRSKFYSHRVGSCVFRGPKLISSGYNKHKSHPKNVCWSMHAEFSSLIRLINQDLSDVVLYVIRLTRTDRVSCAKPCEACQKIISKLGIRKVYYTNHDGILEKLH